jgi:hypothetical protein
MRSLTFSRTAAWIFGLSTLFVCALPCPAATQEGNPPPRGVNIPDPTPRPQDIRQKYDDDPTQVKKQQELIALKNQLRAREIWLDVNKILYYAQELKAEVSSHDKGSPIRTNSAKAEDIEKLAKEVRDKLKEH